MGTLTLSTAEPETKTPPNGGLGDDREPQRMEQECEGRHLSQQRGTRRRPAAHRMPLRKSMAHVTTADRGVMTAACVSEAAVKSAGRRRSQKTALAKHLAPAATLS